MSDMLPYERHSLECIMRHENKRKVVEAGGTSDHGYTMKVPPVCSDAWDTDDWIKWIESTGGFYVKRYDNAS